MISLIGFTSANMKDIKLGNTVDLFGMKGRVVIECGAIGVGCKIL